VQVAKALIAFDAKINAVSIDNKTPLDIVLQHPAGSSADELEILLLLLGALRYQEMNTSNGAEGTGPPGVQNGNGTATASTIAEMEDDVFTAEVESECEHERRQPSRGELRLLECQNDHNRTNIPSPVRQKLTPSLPTLPEGQSNSSMQHKLFV
jgi:hypothetical protein